MSDGENLTAEQAEKLAHFQEITHIDSIDECKQILEAFQWNIELAVQNTFNEPTPNPVSNDQPNLFAADSLRSNVNNNLNNQLPEQIPESLSRNSSQQSLPNVNFFTQRTLSYPSTQQAVVPSSFFEWSVFLVSFPFRFIYSTIVDIASFFWSIFENNTVQDNYDPQANVAEFQAYFNEKFGANHVEFLSTSYSRAVDQAKRDLKFLLIYLHENDNKDCIKFANETMSNTDVTEYLRNNFLVWACSKNLPEGRKVFNAVKSRRCPFLGVIVIRNFRMTMVSKIEGPITAPELLIQLSNIVAENEAELVAARHDREQRNQNQLIRQQQDQAYEESLRLDREKAKRKQELEEANRKAEELERQKLEEEIEKQNRILNRKSELRKILIETSQPDASNPLSIKLIVKLPTGNRFERIFLKTDPLSELYKFVFSNEECPINFEIVTNFPRKVIECSEETSTSIQDFGINQSMILFVNDLDA